MPRVSPYRPDTAWVPASISLRRPVRTTSTTRATSQRPARERPCWDLRWTVDGKRYFRRFDRASDAEAFAADLQRGHLRRWLFDPVGRRFVDPAGVEDAASPARAVASESVFSWTQRYWDRKWPDLEPRGRSELARYLNRARRWLVDMEPNSQVGPAVETYLATVSLSARPSAAGDAAMEGQRWLAEHSLPMGAVGRAELEGLVERYSTHARDADRRVSAASIRRMVADLRPCWDRAVIEEVIPSNPWRQVDLRLRGRAGGRRASTPVAADADAVLSIEQVFALAAACGTKGSWGTSVEAFVLAMGVCGLRPSEAAGLVIGDLELPDAGAGWLTVRRSRRRVPERFLDTDEDPEWGPLKGRELTDTRRVPVPAAVVDKFRTHLRAQAATAPTDLVFQRNGRPFDLRAFGADVWNPGRAALFPLDPSIPDDSPLQPKLARLRRHDLRHSACSAWLRAGVDVTVCQRWSGHKRLSVFLDVYQGVMPGREDDGVGALEALFCRELAVAE